MKLPDFCNQSAITVIFVLIIVVT